jgi:hypothetical protein
MNTPAIPTATVIGAPRCPHCQQPTEWERYTKERLDPRDPNSPARWVWGWVCHHGTHPDPVVVPLAAA